MVNVCISCVWGRRSIIDPDMLQFLHGSGHVFEVGFSSILYFSLQDINLTLGLLPCRRHVIWRDSVRVGSSGLAVARPRQGGGGGGGVGGGGGRGGGGGGGGACRPSEF